MRSLPGKKILTLAVMATLLAGGTAWASPVIGGDAPFTVNSYRNSGTEEEPFTSIAVNKDSLDDWCYTVNIYQNKSTRVPIYVQQGILLDKDKATTQTTYLGTDTTISVNSTGLDASGSDYELKNIGSVGIMNYGTVATNVLTVSAAGPITINTEVQAGDGTSADYVKKGAFAAGVLNTNGKETGWRTDPTASGTITINQPLTITATAKGGNASSTKATVSSYTNYIGADATARAAGLYNNYGTGTINVGQVNITATAQGGSAADPNSAGNVASASAYGAYNDGGKLNIGVENTTSTFAATATGGIVQAGNGTGDYSSAFAYGINSNANLYNGINIKGNVHITEVKAVAGAANDAAQLSQAIANGITYVASITGNVDIDAVSAETISSGVDIKGAYKSAGASGIMAWNNNTTIGGNIHIGTVKAVGGTALGENANVGAMATGLTFYSSKVSGTVTVDEVLAQGGTANQGYASADATGMRVTSSTGMPEYQQITLTKVAALAGSAQYNALAKAYGLQLGGSNPCTIDGLTAKVQALGTASDYTHAIANGLYNSNSNTTKLTGDTVLSATITNSAADKEDEAAAVYTYGTGAVLDINTGDGTTSLGKKVQLTGDVVACSSGTNNIILDGAASYLQGNILNATATESETGTNNLTFTNGATWQPVFDNRNGSFINGDDTTTYSLTNTVNDITTAANLTLSNAGKIDLTWDDTTRDPNVTKRTMTIASLAGDGGVLVVNSNIQQNIADEFIITSNSATNLGIDVAYDPALAVSGLDNDSSITGKARVLTINGGTTTPAVAGVADSYNGYDYTPTITTENDGKYYVTKLAITNVEPTPTPTPDPTPTPTPTPTPDPTPTPTPEPTPDPRQTLIAPSRPMREARHERMAMHNLWVSAELNNLQKRLGDLRSLESAESGIWARYEHNKLEKGADNSLKYNYFQLGYDKDFQGDTGTFYRGAAFSYAKGTGEYEVGSGDLSEGTLSLYQTWVAKNGNYYDLIAKVGKLSNSYDVTNTANPYTSDCKTWSYSIGGEIGRRIRKTNGFFVEPQLEFTLSRINSTEYDTSTGMNIYAEAQNSAIARLGLAAGRELKNVGSYYAKASYFHDFGGGVNLIASDSTFYPYAYSEDTAKNWCIFTLGGTAKVAKNCNVYGELSKYTGQLTNNVQVNVGARWSF